MLKTLGRSLLIALAALAAPVAMAKPAAAAQNWAATVARTANDSYIFGNPAAPLHVVAYISFSCPHCAAFEAEAEVQLRIGMIAPGKGSYEIRPFLRNEPDVAASLLAECGSPSKFMGNTQALLSKQAQWTAPYETLTDAQRERWLDPNFATRMRAVASDLGLYAIMEARGYDRTALDRCLADKALADRLAEHTKDAAEKEYVNGTPGFQINGVTLAGTYSWDTLKPQIDARLR